MSEIKFENGFRASLDYNTFTKDYTLRLYDTRDCLAASIQCQPEDFEKCANVLMIGYFFGANRSIEAFKHKLNEFRDSLT